jgi:hypothetical protein
MNKKELIDGYEQLLSRYQWVWFGTLTFRRRDIKFWLANEVFWQWIVEIQNAEGIEDNGSKHEFHWFRVTEYGAFRNNLHFHILVGGLKNPSKWPWVLRWQELAGDADIFYFIPSRGGIRYLLKTADPKTDFEIEYEL